MIKQISNAMKMQNFTTMLLPNPIFCVITNEIARNPFVEHNIVDEVNNLCYTHIQGEQRK